MHVCVDMKMQEARTSFSLHVVSLKDYRVQSLEHSKIE